MKNLPMNSYFSLSLIGLVFLSLLNWNDPVTVWLEKSDREEIENDTKAIKIKVILSEPSAEQVIVRLKYEGEAALGQDFKAPLVAIIPKGDSELTLTLDLLPGFHSKKDLNISILSAENAIANTEGVRYLINRSTTTQEDKQVVLRGPQGFNTGSQSSQGGATAFGNTAVGDSAGHRLTTGDFNTIMGASAGSHLTSGGRNTLIGFEAGYFNTSSELVAIGYHAARAHTSGFDNTLIGTEAGKSITTAGDNTIIGTEAGEFNTTGYDNTFIGEESGTENTTGYENTFIGEDAGFENTRGYKNTYIGNEAGYSDHTDSNPQTGYKNTGIGDESLQDIRQGHHNTAVGDSAGVDIGAGIWNTMVGAASGVATEWADYNTFVGAMAGWDNNRTNHPDDANRNTYVGFYCGFSNREGEDNVGMGAFSNFNNTIRSRCTFIGANQDIDENDVECFGFDVYNDSQYAMAFGQSTYIDRNAQGAIAMGYDGTVARFARYSIGLGYQNNMAGARGIGIGYQVDVDNPDAIAIGASSINQGDGSIVIGANSSVRAPNSILIGYGVNLAVSNEAYIGNPTTSSIGGAVNWTATSDARFKTNVQENVPGLGFINALRPVTYHMDVDAVFSRQGRKLLEELKTAAAEKEAITYTGFLAQEVEAAAKEIGYDFSGIDAPKNEGDSYGLRYAEFVVPLVKSVQELHEKVKDREAKIQAQQTEIEQYKALLKELSARVDALEAAKATKDNNSRQVISPKDGQ